MLNQIPGGYRIKKYLYRMIFGILCLPLGPILLIWNEHKAILNEPVFRAYHSEIVYWGFRTAGFLIILFCFQRIFSFINLFMMKIPLTYNEIRAGIWVNALLISIASTLIILSVCWIYAQPFISLILVVLAIGLFFILLIKRRQKKKLEKSQIVSVQPRQAKNT